MTDSTELDVVIARPLITPEQAADAARELRRVIADVLEKGKHYMPIRGKDVLLKAGAEELQKVFGLNFTYSDLEAGRDGDSGAYTARVKCSVRNAAGTILSESYGYFDETEAMGRKGPVPGANTIIKMAQKRAYVGAVMSATGTSELFTQDLEDEEQPSPRPPAPSTPDEWLLLAELFARKGGGTLVEAQEWVLSKPKRMERDWVANRVLDLLLKPDHGSEKKDAEPVSSAQEEDSYQQGLPDEVEPELPADPPTIEVEVEEDDDHPF